MKKILTSTAAICMIALLSACGGGGGGGSNYSDTSPVDGGNGNGGNGNGGNGGNGGEQTVDVASMTTAERAAWVKAGGTISDLQNTQGIQRSTRTVTDENGRHTVRVDGVEGYGDALVAYRGPDGTTTYQLADNAAPMGTAMTGVYTGRISADWTPNAEIGLQSGEGNVALTLDTETGRGGIDSIIGGSNSNIQVMGELALDGNKLSATDVVTQFRDGEGYFMRDEVAAIDANVIGRDGVNAIIGTVVSDNSNGGFAADLNPEFSLE